MDSQAWPLPNCCGYWTFEDNSALAVRDITSLQPPLVLYHASFNQLPDDMLTVKVVVEYHNWWAHEFINSICKANKDKLFITTSVLTTEHRWYLLLSWWKSTVFGFLGKERTIDGCDESRALLWCHFDKGKANNTNLKDC